MIEKKGKKYKNEKEKKDYKNAERAAVILRRLEYTHGLGEKINKEDKIIFYLMKGAALIIEDWWIKIMNDKKKNDNYNTLMGKIKKKRIIFRIHPQIQLAQPHHPLSLRIIVEIL